MEDNKQVLYNKQNDALGSFNKVGEYRPLGISANAISALQNTNGLLSEVETTENNTTVLPFTSLGTQDANTSQVPEYNASVQSQLNDQVVTPTPDMLGSVTPEPTVASVSQENTFENPMANVITNAQNFMDSPESSNTFNPVETQVKEVATPTSEPTIPVFENTLQPSSEPTITQTGEIVRENIGNVTNEDLLNQGIPVFKPPVAPKPTETMNEPAKDFGSTIENVLPMNNAVETSQSLVEEPLQAQETLNTKVGEPTYVSPFEHANVTENVSQPVLNSGVKDEVSVDKSSKIDSLIETADRIIEEMSSFRKELENLKNESKVNEMISEEPMQNSPVIPSVPEKTVEEQSQPFVPNTNQEQSSPVQPFAVNNNVPDINQFFGRMAS